jgi:hypothetical protein
MHLAELRANGHNVSLAGADEGVGNTGGGACFDWVELTPMSCWLPHMQRT